MSLSLHDSQKHFNERCQKPYAPQSSSVSTKLPQLKQQSIDICVLLSKYYNINLLECQVRSVTMLGKRCSGHSCWPPRPNDEASTNVYVNDIGAHREGDHWPSHCCGDSCHDSHLAHGSSSVYVNGKQLGRIGDPVECGSIVIEGSLNVFCGD